MESKLGYTEVMIGQKSTGLAKLRHAARVVRDVHSIHDRLMKGCIMAGRLEEAADVAEQFTHVMGYPKLFLRAASIRVQLQQWAQADAILLRGLQLFPESPELQEARSEVANKKLEDLDDSVSGLPIAGQQPC
jgi:hypothetical protein